jgi:uncharacterized protein (DUF924 family)
MMVGFAAADIVDFWREAGRDKWFEQDESFDQVVRLRFLPTYAAAANGELAAWEESAEGALALVLLLDQFPRNMFRGHARAFSTDARAREVAGGAIARGADARLDNDLLQFLYMPFMHSEQIADQLRCVDLFGKSGDTGNLKYAEDHADIIRRFGRFPHRNRILGRTTTPEEQAFLDQGGFSG